MYVYSTSSWTLSIDKREETHNIVHNLLLLVDVESEWGLMEPDSVWVKEKDLCIS